MKKYSLPFFFLSLACASNAFAYSLEFVVNEINNISGYPSSAYSDINCLVNTQTSSGADKDVDQCMRDLCGKPSDVKTVSITDLNFNQLFTDKKDALDLYNQNKSKIDKINSSIRKNLNTKNDFLNTFLTAEGQKKHYANKHDDFFVNSFSQIMRYQTKSTAIRKSDGSTSYADDFSYELFDKKFHPLLKKYINTVIEDMNNNVNLIIYDPVKNPKEIERIIKYETAKLKLIIEKNRTNPNYANVKIDTSLLDNSKNAMATVNYIKELKNIYNDEYNISFCIQKECQNFIKEFEADSLKKLHSQIKTDLQNINDNTQDFTLKCKTSSAMKALANYETSEMLKEIPIVKEKILTNYTAKLSPKSQDRIKKYLDKELKIVFEQETEMKKTGQYFKEDIEADLQDQESSVNSKPTVESLREEQLKNEENKNPLKTAFSSLRSCGSPSISAWDYFKKDDKSKSKDNISLSLYSCKNTQHGKHILAHEIGHSISHLFKNNDLSNDSYKIFLEQRKCVSSQYLNNDASLRNYHPGDKLKTEEDHADLIASIALNDPSIKSCALLMTDRAQSKFTNLDFILPPGISHSSIPFRVLNEANQKGIPFPKSCEKVLTAQNQNIRLNQCIKK